MTVVFCTTLLFVGTKSGSFADTLAVRVIAATALVLTMIVIVLTLPLPMTPNVHPSVEPVRVQLPPPARAETSVTVLGKLLVRATLFAVDGPRLVTVKV